MTRRLRHRIAIAGLCVLAAVTLVAGRQPQSGTVATLAQLSSEMRTHRGGEALDPRTPLKASDLPGLSEARAREESAWAAGVERKLSAIDQSTLTHDQWLTFALLSGQARLMAQADRWYWFGIPVTPYASPLRALPSRFAGMPVKTDADRRAYLDGLNQIAPIMTAIEAKLRGQLDRGNVLPAEEIALVLPFVKSFEGAPDSSPFGVAPARLAGVPADAADAFSKSVARTIVDSVNPSVAKLWSLIDGAYRAKAPSRVGLSQYAGGSDYYRFLIRSHTGLDLTPEQIHQIGLDEVKRINGEFDKVRVATGFSGSLADFKTFLRKDARFIPHRSEEMGEKMMAAIKLIEPRMHDYFGVLPKAPYGVKRLEAGLEGSMTYGYYEQPAPPGQPSGLYRYNGSTPEQRSTLMAAALIYHELIPGHHLQIALTQENAGLDPLRRTLLYTAFTEGWGEYASDLAGEMGMYDADPYARAGRLAMDIFLSSRLVVDTGMNALGWSLERARQFMRENTLESDAQIATETLRYSSDIPGQALAYKLGSRQIHQERTRAERAMGDRFDIRRFHDYVLGSGAMPLDVLDGHVTCFIAERHR